VHAALRLRLAALPRDALTKFAALRKFGKPTANVLRLLLEMFAIRYTSSSSLGKVPIDLEQSRHVEIPGIESLPPADCASHPTSPAVLSCPRDTWEQADSRQSLPIGVVSILRESMGPCSRLFDALQHHPPRWSHPKEALEWSRACAAFRTVLSHARWWDGVAHPLPSDADLHAMVSRLDSNIFGCFVRDGGPLFGHACYLQAATFNHSCSPNCSATSGVECIDIIADEEILEGEELCISYIDTNRPREARRKALKDHYNFDCMCRRCNTEALVGGRKKLRYTQGRKVPEGCDRAVSTQRRAKGVARSDGVHDGQEAQSHGKELAAHSHEFDHSPDVKSSRRGGAHTVPSAGETKKEKQNTTVPWFEALG